MDLLEVIKKRRSVRKYDSTREVTPELLEKVLDAARWAPSWANTQCVRFVVVRKPETRAALADKLSKGNPAAKAFVEAPLVVVFVAELEKSGYYKKKASDDKAWYMFDAGLVVENFCLAACSAGLGTVVCGAMDYHEAGKLLGLPDGFQVVAITPLGYPTEEPKAPRRKDIAELAFLDKWGGDSVI